MLVDAALVLAVGGVEVVLDTVVAAAGQLLGYVGPLVAQTFVEVEYLAFLLAVDRVLFDVGVQMVMPPLATLFAGAATNLVLFFEPLRHVGPAFSPERRDQLHNRLVFLK